MALIRFLFLGFFPIQFIAAGLLLWMAQSTEETASARKEAYTAMLDGAPPATAPVGDLRPDPTPRIPDEVSVTAQMSLGNNVRLVRTTNGIKQSEHLLYLLMDPDAAEDEKTVRAGIVLLPAELDGFTDFLEAQMTGWGAQGPVVTVPGLLATPGQASHARDAIKERGLVLGDGFYFITPFLTGREAGLTQAIADEGKGTTVFYWLAAAFAGMGLFNMARVIRRRSMAKAVPAAPVDRPLEKAKPRSARVVGGLLALGFLGVYLSLKLFNAYFADTGGMPQVTGPDGVGAMLGSVAGVILPVLLSFVAMAVMVVFWVRRGMRAIGLGRATSAAVGPATVAAPPAAATGLRPLPDWALAQRPEPAPAAPTPVLPPAVVSRRPDVPAIRPGFSLSSLLPARKSRSACPDPFERLALQVRAERGSEPAHGEVRTGPPAAR